MKLPVPLDMEPMLSAISDAGIPKGERWEYEPKWDGFRCLAFRAGDQVDLRAKSGKPLTVSRLIATTSIANVTVSPCTSG